MFIAENLIGGHLYKDFTLGRFYPIWKQGLFYYVESDTGKTIMVSNNAKRLHFKLTKIIY